jgi:hypothetical protein
MGNFQMELKLGFIYLDRAVPGVAVSELSLGPPTQADPNEGP